MSDDQPPIEAYDGLPTPQEKQAAERSSRENDISHLPPQNLEAEEALLGAMIWTDAAIVAADELGVSADVFYRPSHRMIYDAIQSVRTDGAVDELTVIDRLRKTTVPGEGGKKVKALTQCGGPAAIMSLVERVPAVANHRAYAKEVVATATKRRFVEIGHELATMGYDNAVSPEDAQEQAEQLILETARKAGRRHAAGEEFESAESVAAFIEQYDRLQDEEAYNRETLSWGSVELDERLGRMERGALYVPAGWTKHGKALQVDEPVLTPSGWVRIGDIEVGDEVIAIDGKPTRVTGVFPQGERQVWNVRTADGTEILADVDHLWTVEDRRGVERTVTTGELQRAVRDGKRRAYLPTFSAAGRGLPDVDLPLDPYVTGALLGDGCMLPGRTDVAFSTADEEMIYRITTRLPEGAEIKHRKGYDYGISGINQHVAGMRAPSHLKRVPPVYMTASVRQRARLLRGLLDTDGWVQGKGSVRFSSTSRGLAEDVRMLALSLGGCAKVSKKAPGSYTHNGVKLVGRESFVVSLQMPIHMMLFGLTRKERWAQERTKPRIRRRVESVRHTGRAECVCIAVEHERKLFLTRDYVPTHNTWWCLDVIEAVARQGHRSLLHSAEMNDKEVTERLVAMGGHDYTKVQEKKLPLPVIRERLTEVEEWSRKTVQGKTTVARVKSEVMRAKLEGRPYRLVVIDHLGLLRPDRGAKFQPRREFVEDAVAELKAHAEEHGYTLLLVAQLSRPERTPGNHPRFKRQPFEGDLKDASGIEQIATCVIFVYRHMDAETGKFVDQDASLVMPFHRSRPTPKALACRFTLPKDADPSGSYRFRPVAQVCSSGQEQPADPSPVQQRLEGSFGPVVVVTPDDVEQIY